MQADLALAPARFEGLRLNEGIAIGRAVLHQPRVSIRQMVADDPDVELERFDEAVETCTARIDAMLADSDMADGGEHREILESYRMFAEDRGWLGRIGEAIRSGLTAEARCSACRTTRACACRRSPTPICASASPTSKTSPTGCCVI